jgi:nitroreductase
MDVYEAIRTRRSVRNYSSKAISDDVLRRLKIALRSAPSACNNQPWKFIFVTDSALRKAVSDDSNKQKWMAESPVIVVGCGLTDQAYPRMGGYGNSVDVDLAIAIDHLTLAAAAEGLGTCWIGAFNEERIKEILKIPKDVKVVAMTPLGYPASNDLIFPLPEERRKSEKEIFSTDYYTR